MQRKREFSYSAFGLHISSDIEIPEFARTEGDGQKNPYPDHQPCHHIKIREESHHDWPSLESTKLNTRVLSMAPGDWRLELEGIGWYRAVNGIVLTWERWHQDVSENDIRTFLITSALGALLIQRGAMPLHATTITRDNKAVLLLGSPTTGKSTLAYCLLQQGWRLLSSEISVVDKNGYVWPGIQQIKLWHGSLAALGLNASSLQSVRQCLKRYRLLPPKIPVSYEPARLNYIYGLEYSKSVKNTDKTPAVNEDPISSAGDQLQLGFQASERDALIRLRNQAYHPRFYRAMGMEANLFIQASSLVANISGYWLFLPNGISRMKKAIENADLLDPKSISAYSPS